MMDDNGIRHPWDSPPPEGAATQVAPGVLWMRLPLPMRLDHVNVYALDDGAAGWTVLDTGFDSRRSRAVWQALLAGPLGGRPVNRVVITHHHPDHVGLAAWLMAEYGASLAMSRTAWLSARMLTLDVQAVPSPESLAFWRAAGVAPDHIARMSTERPFNFADVVAPLPPGFDRLEEGALFRMGGRDWDIRMGDGHAPEHATFWSRDDDLVIGGDQLLPGISPNLGVYPTEPGADPVGDWLHSCARLAPHAQGRHLVLPGHKLPFTGLPLRLGQMAENHTSALIRLTDHLASPRVATDCFAPLFKREIGGGDFGLALAETVGHLNHLLRCGTVRRWRDGNDAWLWQGN